MTCTSHCKAEALVLCIKYELFPTPSRDGIPTLYIGFQFNDLPQCIIANRSYDLAMHMCKDIVFGKIYLFINHTKGVFKCCHFHLTDAIALVFTWFFLGIHSMYYCPNLMVMKMPSIC